MNREIKFKAKRLDNQEWVIGDLLHPCENRALIIPREDCGAFVVDPNTVCQFTGKYDCYGEELYENDIVTHKRNFDRETIVWSNSDSAYNLVDLNGNKICELRKTIIICRIGSALDREGNHE